MPSKREAHVPTTTPPRTAAQATIVLRTNASSATIAPSCAKTTTAAVAGTLNGEDSFYATSTTFGVECGCDGVVDDDAVGGLTPAPSGVQSSVATPAPASSCAAGSGVSVTSSEYPKLEGCLEEADVFSKDGVEFWSATGVIASVVPDGEVTVCASFSRAFFVFMFC